MIPVWENSFNISSSVYNNQTQNTSIINLKTNNQNNNYLYPCVDAH